jgi:FdhD protein
MSHGVRRLAVRNIHRDQCRVKPDDVAIEEPLEIRLEYEQEGRVVEQSVSVTMRTPGDDRELAAGFLFAEGVVRRAEDIRAIGQVAPPEDGKAQSNVIRVSLSSGVTFDPAVLKRFFYTASSCGVCGKTAIESLRMNQMAGIPEGGPVVREEVIQRLGKRMREGQAVFDQTGGLHAAALFDPEGNLLELHEDVGRHNAVDKLIGERFLEGEVPVPDGLMMISGRASFEIMQKALMAGIPIVAAVSAPSSLSVDLASEFGMTLLGFVRGESFNIYAGSERIQQIKSAMIS